MCWLKEDFLVKKPYMAGQFCVFSIISFIQFVDYLKSLFCKDVVKKEFYIIGDIINTMSISSLISNYYKTIT